MRYVKDKYPQYHVTVCLFHTDDIQLCLDRAIIRERAGGHSVSELIIREMYENTLKLLQNNVNLLTNLMFIDVQYDILDLVFELNHKENRLFIGSNLPNWLLQNFPKISQLRK